MHRSDQTINFQDVSERNLPTLAARLHGYTKFTSMLWIRAFRQPIADGLIIRSWSADAEKAVESFCYRHQCSELLLRVDTRNKRWSKRRGGYLIPRSSTKAVVRALTKEDKIAAFLEPLSPFRDRYCLAGVTDDLQKNVTVEVVGPGFDTSDLLRADVSPHERFEVVLPRGDLSSAKYAVFCGQRTYVVRGDDYTRTVEERLTKIGARLRNPAYPDLVLGSPKFERSRLKQEALEFLNRTHQTLILTHSHRYQPIPKHFVAKFVSGIGSILDCLERYEISLGCTAFSGTFTTRGRFVFWDFFPADNHKAQQLHLEGRALL